MVEFKKDLNIIRLRDYDKDLDIIDDFCELIQVFPVELDNDLTLYDVDWEEFSCENYENINDIIARLVERAIDYFRAEYQCETESDLEDGEKLYKLGLKYNNGSKWLEGFRKKLDEFKKDLKDLEDYERELKEHKQKGKEEIK